MSLPNIFVPRMMDASNVNAQNLNAKAMLSRFSRERARWNAVHYHDPDPAVVANGVHCTRLMRTRLYKWHLALEYQRKWDAVFYPGPHWFDEIALTARAMSGRKIPVIATMEGLVADEGTRKKIAAHVGHEVHAQPVAESDLRRVERLLRRADHIIAISPFLQKIGEFLYGPKVSWAPLGIDSGVFHAHARTEPERSRVVAAGTVKESKNPSAFLRLAEAMPDTEFVWFGGGELLDPLRAEIARRGWKNIEFAGPKSPEELADEFRRATVFVMTSPAEGVPKVTQEAAACGLPVVAYGFYEPTSVLDGITGRLVWNDEELIGSVKELCSNRETATKMGAAGAELAKQWDWDRVAGEWESRVLEMIG